MKNMIVIYGQKSKVFKAANPAVMRALRSAYVGRKNKKSLAGEFDRRYTICISTQVGCPMGCVFCATGKMGFKRNLSWREIVDEVRFWQKYLFLETSGKGQMSNIVLMGQGEPLLNYNNVKEALRIILDNTEIGPRQITVSTVGVPNIMEKMIVDKDWPPVRFALSLHNAIESERALLIPSHQKDFLDWLVAWSKKYHARFSSRTQFIGIEYTVVPNKNDSEKHLQALIKLASKMGKVRINLIPLNSGVFIKGDNSEVLNHWHEELMKKGFTSTIRLSQGQDISAACGQLASKAC